MLVTVFGIIFICGIVTYLHRQNLAVMATLATMVYTVEPDLIVI